MVPGNKYEIERGAQKGAKHNPRRQPVKMDSL
jgi:hypothetical protein